MDEGQADRHVFRGDSRRVTESARFETDRDRFSRHCDPLQGPCVSAGQSDGLTAFRIDRLEARYVIFFSDRTLPTGPRRSLQAEIRNSESGSGNRPVQNPNPATSGGPEGFCRTVVISINRIRCRTGIPRQSLQIRILQAARMRRLQYEVLHSSLDFTGATGW